MIAVYSRTLDIVSQNTSGIAYLEQATVDDVGCTVEHDEHASESVVLVPLRGFEVGEGAGGGGGGGGGGGKRDARRDELLTMDALHCNGSVLARPTVYAWPFAHRRVRCGQQQYPSLNKLLALLLKQRVLGSHKKSKGPSQSVLSAPKLNIADELQRRTA